MRCAWAPPSKIASNVTRSRPSGCVPPSCSPRACHRRRWPHYGPNAKASGLEAGREAPRRTADRQTDDHFRAVRDSRQLRGLAKARSDQRSGCVRANGRWRRNRSRRSERAAQQSALSREAGRRRRASLVHLRRCAQGQRPSRPVAPAHGGDQRHGKGRRLGTRECPLSDGKPQQSRLGDSSRPTREHNSARASSFARRKSKKTAFSRSGKRCRSTRTTRTH